MNTPRPYRAPLPAPLAGARRRALLAAWLRRSAPTTLHLDGFSLMYERELPDPRPVLGYSPSALLAEGLDARPGERVLVLDSGAGLVSLSCARAGATVTSLDPHPAAAHCLRRSSIIAGLGEPDMRTGGLEQLAGDERFDVIAWAPPQVEGPSTPDPRASRWILADRTVVTDVLALARDRLQRGGRLLFPMPDRDATPWLHDAFRAHGLRFAAVRFLDAPVLGPVRLYKAWVAQLGAPGEVPAGDSLAGAGWVLKDR